MSRISTGNEPTLRQLRSVAVFADLFEEDLEEVARTVSYLRAFAGQNVVSHLERSSSFFLVLEGQVRVRMASAAGRNVAFRLIGAGGHFGEIAALTGAPRIASVVADTPCLLAEMTAPQFLDFIARRPTASLRLLQSMARNIVVLTDRVFELSTYELRARLCAELLRLARDAPLTDGVIAIDPAPSHAELADMLGALREGVSREFRVLARMGLVRTGRRHIAVLDIARMRTIVENEGGITATQLVDWNV